MGAASPSMPIRKFKDRSALEVIFTTLHAGVNFRAKPIRHRGFTRCRLIRRQCALLLSAMDVTRDRALCGKSMRGASPSQRLRKLAKRRTQRHRGAFHAGSSDFRQSWFLSRSALSPLPVKSVAFPQCHIHWKMAAEFIKKGDDTPETDIIHFPNGLADSLVTELEAPETLLAPLWRARRNSRNPPMGRKVAGRVGDCFYLSRSGRHRVIL